MQARSDGERSSETSRGARRSAIARAAISLQDLGVCEHTAKRLASFVSQNPGSIFDLSVS